MLLPRSSLLGKGVLSGRLGSDVPISHRKAPCCTVIRNVFPGCFGYANALQVTFADVPEAQTRASDWSVTFCQFVAVEEVLRDAARFHTPGMSEPAETPLAEKAKHAAYAGSLQDFSVVDLFLPGNV